MKVKFITLANLNKDISEKVLTILNALLEDKDITSFLNYTEMCSIVTEKRERFRSLAIEEVTKENIEDVFQPFIMENILLDDGTNGEEITREARIWFCIFVFFLRDTLGMTKVEYRGLSRMAAPPREVYKLLPHNIPCNDKKLNYSGLLD